MPRKKKFLAKTQPPTKDTKTYKVRLDDRTVITIHHLKALAFWKQRYPKAEVIG